MNDDLEAIDGLCEKIVEQRDRIAVLEAALREISTLWGAGTYAKQIARAALTGGGA